MNDDFIGKSLPKLRKEFAESLYAKISKDTSNVSKAVMYQKLRRRRWLQATAIVLGVLILIAWSQLKFLVRYVPIGNLWLVEYNQTTQYSSDNLAAVPFVPTPLPPQIFDMTSMPSPEPGDLIIYYPSWVPEGYQPIARPNENISTTLVFWSNDAQQKIRLFVETMHPYAPAGTWKEVRVQGKPAILIYGRLALTSPDNPTATRKWDNTLGLQLHWIIGEQVYGLETFGSYLSEEDLIRMAESMEEELPPWPRLNAHTP
jgi:hypothetical protein